MNKRAAVLLLLALVLFVLPLAGQEKVDLIVLLDSSKSMFTYYNDVIDYVLSGTVREYMRFGDTFHLITFADSTTVEMTQPLRTEQDLRSVIARLYLLYPLGRNTDLVTALKNVHGYVAGLPASSTKYIILITDGMHSPAPGTAYADMDAAGVTKEISDAATHIKDNGWILKIVRIPFDGSGNRANASASAGTNAGSIVTVVPDGAGNDPRAAGGVEAPPTSPGSGDYLDELAKAGGADVTKFDPANGDAAKSDTVGLPRITIPSDLGLQSYAFSFPAELYNATKGDLDLELTALLLPGGADILIKKARLRLSPGTSGTLSIKVRLPGSIEPGANVLTLEPRFADGVRVNPARSSVQVVLKRGVLATITGNKIWLASIFVLVVLVLVSVLLIARYTRRAHRKTEEPIVNAMIDSTAAARHNKDAARLLAASTQTRHDSGSLRTGADTHAKDAAQLLSNGKHAHRDASAAADLLAAVRPTAPAGALLAAPAGDEVKAVSILDSWQKKPASRLALPAKEIPASSTIVHRAPLHYEARIVQAGAQRIILHVRGQNPNIGRRNIHIMHAGSKKSIGGRGSEFLVFLLPIPRNIACAYYDGVDITIVPSIPECFPDSTGIIERCLGREIRMVNTRGKELFLMFDRYIPPVDTINKLLHCIESPGLLSIELPSEME